MAEIALETDQRPKDTSFLGHPKGLGYLAFTEAWERFSYYGMLALLALYMVDQLLKPGHIEHVFAFGLVNGPLQRTFGPLAGQALASQILGLYTAAVYVTPIIGGVIGDRWIGRRAAIAAGAILMAAGHFMMAFEQAFIFALLALVLGAGLLKGNLASQVGSLYAEDDPRRSDAFQIYTLSVQVGVIAAPLVCGTLGELVGWHYGFAAAGIGMLIGLCIYLAGYKYMPADRRAPKVEAMPKERLTGADWRALVALVILIPILALAFVGNNQIFNAYMIWARDSVDMGIGGFRMPVTWLQSYDAGVSAATLIFAVWTWRRLADRGFAPHELFKLLVGCSLSIFGFLLLALGAAIAGGGKVPLFWLLIFHWINDLGFANILPVGLALFSRAAPKQINATMIGVFYLLFAGTNLMVGYFGSLYGTMSHQAFWLLHAGITGASAAAIFLFYRPLKTALKVREAAAA